MMRTFPSFFGGEWRCGERRLTWDTIKKETPPPQPPDVDRAKLAEFTKKIRTADKNDTVRKQIAEYIQSGGRILPDEVEKFGRDLQSKIMANKSTQKEFDEMQGAEVRALFAAIPQTPADLLQFATDQKIISAMELHEWSVAGSQTAQKKQFAESAKEPKKAEAPPPPEPRKGSPEYWDKNVVDQRKQKEAFEASVKDQWRGLEESEHEDYEETLSALRNKLADLYDQMQTLEKERVSDVQQKFLNRPTAAGRYTKETRGRMHEAYQQYSAKLRDVGSRLGPVTKEFNILNGMHQRHTGKKFSEWRMGNDPAFAATMNAQFARDQKRGGQMDREDTAEKQKQKDVQARYQQAGRTLNNRDSLGSKMKGLEGNKGRLRDQYVAELMGSARLSSEEATVPPSPRFSYGTKSYEVRRNPNLPGPRTTPVENFQKDLNRAIDKEFREKDGIEPYRGPEGTFTAVGSVPSGKLRGSKDQSDIAAISIHKDLCVGQILLFRSKKGFTQFGRAKVIKVLATGALVRIDTRFVRPKVGDTIGAHPLHRPFWDLSDAAVASTGAVEVDRLMKANLDGDLASGLRAAKLRRAGVKIPDEVQIDPKQPAIRKPVKKSDVEKEVRPPEIKSGSEKLVPRPEKEPKPEKPAAPKH